MVSTYLSSLILLYFSILQAKWSAIWLPGSSFPTPSDLWLLKYCASFRTSSTCHLDQLSVSPSENIFFFHELTEPFQYTPFMLFNTLHYVTVHVHTCFNSIFYNAWIGICKYFESRGLQFSFAILYKDLLTL